MNNFLREVRRLWSISERVSIVLGNESCDLDSAVSSITLAYYYTQNKDLFPLKNNRNVAALPILNISRNELPLKTEVLYYFKQNSIDINNLIFRDDVDESFIRNSDVVLVDHHVSPFADSAVTVYDHRSFDTSSNLNAECEKIIQQVGSCSTLIANLFLSMENPENYKEPLTLLYGAIVLDTVNFCKKADRARQLDIDIIEKIEAVLNIAEPSLHRKTIFDELVRERANVSNLNSYHILFKDMKIISNNSASKKIALPGFPFLVQDYIQMENADKHLKDFIKEKGCCVVVLIGMKVTNESVERDLGLINGSDDDLYQEVLKKITSDDSKLDLKEHEKCNFCNGKFFAQKNIKASRKQILPIVKNVLNSM